MTLAHLTEQAIALLEKAHLSSDIVSIEPCLHGGNNRTYRVKTDEASFALKQYFRQAGDERDRLAAEFAFLSYANKLAKNTVPIAYAQDEVAGLALYEFIEGRAFKPGEVSAKDIDHAIHFFCVLNEGRHHEEANNLPLASESCFSIQHHLNLIDARIQALQQIIPDQAEDMRAAKLVRQLQMRWQTLVDQIKQTAIICSLDLLQLLAENQRCISPSDFGFHNALKLADGSVRFLDFEYAGWDDPAKMSGDFFSQLAVPVSTDYFDHFVQTVMSSFSMPDALIKRAYLLRPVYQVKWCCIALNIFIPVNLARRQFAKPDLNVIDLKRAQLAKAESLVHQLERTHYG